MIARLHRLLRLAGLTAIAGISFSLWQRLIDFCIDSVTSHVTWLAWLQ